MGRAAREDGVRAEQADPLREVARAVEGLEGDGFVVGFGEHAGRGEAHGVAGQVVDRHGAHVVAEQREPAPVQVRLTPVRQRRSRTLAADLLERRRADDLVVDDGARRHVQEVAVAADRLTVDVTDDLEGLRVEVSNH